MERNIICGFVVFVSIVLSGCNLKVYNKETLRDTNQKYQEIKNEWLIPDELFTHFPDSIYSLPIVFLNGTEDHLRYKYHILACYNCNLDSLFSLRRYAYNINSEVFILRENDRMVDIRNNILNGKIPIPDFKNLDISLSNNVTYSNNTMYGLNPNYELAILDYDYFENPKNIELLNSLPRTHRKGYSKGLFINVIDKSVIYWIIYF